MKIFVQCAGRPKSWKRKFQSNNGRALYLDFLLCDCVSLHPCIKNRKIHTDMFQLTRRRRLLTLLGAGVVAGGCAAYAAYSFGWFSTFTEEEEEKDDETVDENNEQDSLSSEQEQTKETMQQLDINAHLEQHFQSIQTIAKETTITTLMVRLSENIKSIDAIDETVEKLKRAQSKNCETLKDHNGRSCVLSVEEKISMWNAVLDGAMCRFICVVWIVPMLQLQIRVQLNILGRTLYLQSLLEHHTLMVSGAQEAFLSIGEYLGEQGCTFMMQRASTISTKAVGILKKGRDSLVDVVTMKDINRALSAALEMFEQEILSTGDWLQAVIPPNEYIDRIISRVESPEDRHGVFVMWQETVTIMKSPQFSSHFLELCSKRLSGMISEGMEKKITKEMPLVHTIAPLVNEVSRVLDTSSDYFSTLSSMQEIQDMSARVYANGSL